MSEKYLEDRIRKRVCSISLLERREILTRIQRTIDISKIKQPREWEMTSTMIFEGLMLKWRAQKTSFEKPVVFLANGCLEEDKTLWMPHAPDIPTDVCDPELQEGYRSFLERYYNDFLIQKAFSAAIVQVCMQKERG